MAMTQSVYAMKMVLDIQTIHVTVMLEMGGVVTTTILKCVTMMAVRKRICLFLFDGKLIF